MRYMALSERLHVKWGGEPKIRYVIYDSETGKYMDRESNDRGSITSVWWDKISSMTIGEDYIERALKHEMVSALINCGETRFISIIPCLAYQGWIADKQGELIAVYLEPDFTRGFSYEDYMK